MKPGRTRGRGAAGNAPFLARARDLGIRRGGRWLVRHVDLTVRRGEIVTLIGPNGSGKSTTARALLGLLKADEGHIETKSGLSVGYVPQAFAIERTLPLSVARLMTLTGRHERSAIRAALGDVGIEDLIDAPVQRLSGGEFQRAMLARALVRKPDLLVLDEPAQGVDFAGEIALYDRIGAIREQRGCGILLISHDLHIVMAQTDTVVCLNGHVCCSGTPQNVSENPEYRRLFGPAAARRVAVYRHHHDHAHAPDGAIIPTEPGDHA